MPVRSRFSAKSTVSGAGGHLPALCRSAGSSCLAPTPWAWPGVVVRWAEAGLDQVGLASEERAPSSPAKVDSVGMDGDTGPWGPSGCGRVDPGHQESGGQAQCIPRALRSGDKRSLEPSGGEVDRLCHQRGISRSSRSFAACVWNHAQFALLQTSAGASLSDFCCWLGHGMALASGC